MTREIHPLIMSDERGPVIMTDLDLRVNITKNTSDSEDRTDTTEPDVDTQQPTPSGPQGTLSFDGPLGGQSVPPIDMDDLLAQNDAAASTTSATPASGIDDGSATESQSTGGADPKEQASKPRAAAKD